jgi:N-methylhydantoinase A
MGLLTAPRAADLALTRLTDLSAGDSDATALEDIWRELESDAERTLDGQGVAAVRSVRSADCRYRGQAFELEVPAPSPEPAAIAASFHAAHLARYGFEQTGQPVELVTLRLRAEGPPPAFTLPRVPAGPAKDTASLGSRRVLLDGSETDVRAFRREAMCEGDRVDGPALLVGADSTCLVLAGQRGEVDEFGTLVLQEG